MEKKIEELKYYPIWFVSEASLTAEKIENDSNDG